MCKNLVLNGFDRIIPQKQLVTFNNFACAAFEIFECCLRQSPWLLGIGSALLGHVRGLSLARRDAAPAVPWGSVRWAGDRSPSAGGDARAHSPGAPCAGSSATERARRHTVILPWVVLSATVLLQLQSPWSAYEAVEHADGTSVLISSTVASLTSDRVD